MNVQKSTVNKIVASDIPNLDSIAIYLEDISIGKGKITITCYNRSWTYYWGAMGDNDLASFLKSCDNDYLFHKFNSGVEKYIPDEDKIGEHVRSEIIQSRKVHDFSKDKARKLYNKCIEVDDWIEFKLCNGGEYAELMYAVFGDEWWDCHPTRINPEYEYFCRILDAVKEALKG